MGEMYSEWSVGGAATESQKECRLKRNFQPLYVAGHFYQLLNMDSGDTGISRS